MSYPYGYPYVNGAYVAPPAYTPYPAVAPVPAVGGLLKSLIRVVQ